MSRIEHSRDYETAGGGRHRDLEAKVIDHRYMGSSESRVAECGSGTCSRLGRCYDISATAVAAGIRRTLPYLLSKRPICCAGAIVQNVEP